MVKKHQDINKHMTVQFPEHVKYNWPKQLKVVSTANDHTSMGNFKTKSYINLPIIKD